MKRILVFVFVFLSQQGFAQLVLESDSYNFETLRRADHNWVDFKIENKSNKIAHLFRMEVPKNVQVLFSSKSIAPDSSALIRVSFSPKKVGNFKEVLKLYASPWATPKDITIKGEATFIADGTIPCPNFDTPSIPTNSGFHVSIRQENGEDIIEDVSLVIYKSGEKLDEQKTDEHGEVSFELPSGRYFVSARTKTQVIDTALYVNVQNNHLVLTFENERVSIEEPQEAQLPVDIPVAPVAKQEEVVAEIAPEIEADIRDEDPIPILENEESAVLPSSLYSQNNLVFLVDVSTSMKKNGKLDLLKVAMIDLLGVLRPSDRFALISYSSETNTIIQTDNNLDRAACIASIKALQAGGSTEGARAIDVAGKMALSHFVPGGNNQILLATDGAFNEATDKAKKIVAKYDRRDISLSVIGIKCGPFTTKQMTELATIGGGRFIPLSDSFDAGTKLLDEVKRSALK